MNAVVTKDFKGVKNDHEVPKSGRGVSPAITV
jgi:hypothetical protein